jgi:2,4-dienoyl-CoA reductase-like NADH-dependent reductase (Old Yellow Enzyme family)/thioredoxin reductase
MVGAFARWLSAVAIGLGDIDFAADDWFYTCLLSSYIEIDDAIHGAVISDSEAVHAQFFGSGNKLRNAAHAIEQAVFGVDVKVGKLPWHWLDYSTCGKSPKRGIHDYQKFLFRDYGIAIYIHFRLEPGFGVGNVYDDPVRKQIETKGVSDGFWFCGKLGRKRNTIREQGKEPAMIATPLKKIFEPTNIGQMRVKNRIVMPPMGTNYAEAGGAVSQRMIDYYEARARGGTGLVIVEGSAPGLQCTTYPQVSTSPQASLGDDKLIPGWRKLTDAVHKYDARIAIQIMHATLENWNGKVVQVGPSPVVVRARVMGVFGGPPHELTVEEIAERVEWFASAARRAKEAGFDGAEVHGAHQYIVAAFLSSATNQRKDRYGGSVENKARFLVEILQAIKREVGPGFPVWVRFNAQEWGVENGITIEEAKQMVPLVVEAGAQALHVSGYGVGSYITTAPIADTPGFLVPLAEEVKKLTRVPVIAVGRLDLELGEKIIEERKADLIAIGRRLLADPDLPNKVAEGRLNEVIPCIGCMECIERLAFDERGEGVACVVNPALGKEKAYQIKPAGKVKSVVVIGGGPAGMQAAIMAAKRGHKVTLLEKEAKLGGQLNIAALPPFKGDILPWIDYLVSQVEETGVKVDPNTEATIGVVTGRKPDAVVIATGGIPAMPDISGINRPNVVTAQDVLSGEVKVGQNVVIIGGGMVGCETGHYLAEQGKTVTIIEILKRMASDMFPMTRRRLMDGLRSKKVTLLTSATCEEMKEGSVVATTAEGKKESIPADTIVVAVGYKANDGLYKELEGKVPEIYCIGDSSQPRRILEATSEGYRVGLAL